jgi:hypothetical protein
MRQPWILVLTALMATGCARPLFLQPGPVREWPPTLRAVKEAAREGRHAQADSILAQFESRHPTSYEGRQAAYWRALILSDPANPRSSPAAAVEAINRYFAGRATAETYDEATILRRILQRADSLTREVAQAERLLAEVQDVAEARPPAPAEPREPRPAPPSRNLVAEVRRLRDELSKANQELERVRRRLQEQRP